MTYTHYYIYYKGFPGGSAVKNPPAVQETQETWVQSLDQEAGGGHGYSLWYSFLGNPMDRGTWWASVHRVAQNWTRLNRLCMHTLDNILNLGKEKGADFLKKMPI